MSPYIAALILLWGLFDLSNVKPVTASHRHFHHHHRWSGYHLEKSVPRQLSLRAEPSRRWRSLDSWTQNDETRHFRGRSKRYDVDDARWHQYHREVKQATYESMCNYSVIRMDSIHDANNNFVANDVYEMKCESPGKPCHTGGIHYCIETFMTINIEYYDFTENKTNCWEQQISTGCACGHDTTQDATTQLKHTRNG